MIRHISRFVFGVVVFFLCIMVYRAWSPFGRGITYDFVRPAPGIFLAKPYERIQNGNELIGSPIFLDVKPRGNFSSVGISFYGTSEVIVGAEAKEGDNRFFYQPDERSGERGSLWRIDGDNSFLSLRGSHRLFLKTEGDDIRLTLKTQDMNREKGADDVIVRVFAGKDKTPFFETMLPDDGNYSGDQKSSSLRDLIVHVPRPLKGAYYIEIITTNDIFFREIRSAQNIFFEQWVYFGDFVGYSDEKKPLVVYETKPSEEEVKHIIPASRNVFLSSIFSRKDIHNKKELNKETVFLLRDLKRRPDGSYRFAVIIPNASKENPVVVPQLRFYWKKSKSSEDLSSSWFFLHEQTQ